VSSGNGFVVDLSHLCSTVLCITNVEMALIDGINGHDCRLSERLEGSLSAISIHETGHSALSSAWTSLWLL
jgi:hypothetical protein